MTSFPWSRINTGLLLLVLLAVIGLFATRAYGGPLDPPGPIAPTQSTLIFQPSTCAGFPIVVSTSGSYRLAGNLTGCSGKNGIEITTGNVSLDLGGFTLAGGAGTQSGIKSIGTTNRLNISNGNITAWNIDGLDLAGSSNDRVDNIISTYNGNDGIELGGATALRNSTASNNGFSGIFAGVDAVDVTISGCNVDNNFRGIITYGAGAVIDGCEVAGNGVGISASTSSRIVNNQVHHNTAEGLDASDACYIANNSVSWNTGDGIVVGTPGNCTIVENKATANSGSGFVFGAGGGYNWIDSNHASGNGQYGFDIGAANPGYPYVVTRNVAVHNVAGGFTGGLNSDVAAAVTAASATKPFANITD